jgi:hypothetical protein
MMNMRPITLTQQQAAVGWTTPPHRGQPITPEASKIFLHRFSKKRIQYPEKIISLFAPYQLCSRFLLLSAIEQDHSQLSQ